MKSITLFLALLFLSLGAFSQKENASVNFGVFAMPELTGLINSNLVGQEKVNEKIGISLGLNVEFSLPDRLALRLGLGYGFKRFTHIHEGLIFGSDISPTGGFGNESTMESKISYGELQIPVTLLFKYKSGLYFAAGLELNGIVIDNSKRNIHHSDGTVSTLSNRTGYNVNLAPMLSIGYTIPYTGLSFEPMFKYYLKKHIISGSNQYNLGLRITYNFLN